MQVSNQRIEVVPCVLSLSQSQSSPCHSLPLSRLRRSPAIASHTVLPDSSKAALKASSGGISGVLNAGNRVADCSADFSGAVPAALAEATNQIKRRGLS